MERRLEALNREKSALEATMSQPATPSVLADAGRQLKVANDAIETAEAQWLELTEAIEAATHAVV